jgi:hypothetical protein
MCSLLLMDHFNGELKVTDKENEKIMPPLKVMTRSEVINDLLKLLSLVQKHADKEGCQHCLDLLKSVFALK